MRQAKDLFIAAGLAKGRKRRKLYLESAELFDQVAAAGRLPKALEGKAEKARRFAKSGFRLF